VQTALPGTIGRTYGPAPASGRPACASAGPGGGDGAPTVHQHTHPTAPTGDPGPDRRLPGGLAADHARGGRPGRRSRRAQAGLGELRDEGPPASNAPRSRCRWTSEQGAYDTLQAFLRLCDLGGPNCAFSEGDAKRRFDRLARRLLAEPAQLPDGQGGTVPFTYADLIPTTRSWRASPGSGASTRSTPTTLRPGRGPPGGPTAATPTSAGRGSGSAASARPGRAMTATATWARSTAGRPTPRLWSATSTTRRPATRTRSARPGCWAGPAPDGGRMDVVPFAQAAPTAATAEVSAQTYLLPPTLLEAQRR
jgi:hypothetical protein